MGILTGEAALLFFSRGQLLKERICLSPHQVQILSIKSKPHVKELHYPMKETGMHAGSYNIVFVEKKVAGVCLLEQE